MIALSKRPLTCRACSKPRIARYYSILNAVHDSLLTIHDFTGIPWYATIPLSTLALSVITLPIAIQSRRNQQKILALQPILDARTADIKRRCQQHSLPSTFATDVRRAVRAERRALHRKHNVDLAAMLAPPALKLPLWISFSLTLRSMSGSAVPYFTPLDVEPAFHTEGIAWMRDLTLPDGYILLPVLFGMMNLINVEVNASQGKQQHVIRTILERVMRVASIGFIAIAAQMPAAVCLYWASSAGITLCQNIWLNHQFPTYQPPERLAVETPRFVMPEDEDPHMKDETVACSDASQVKQVPKISEKDDSRV